VKRIFAIGTLLLTVLVLAGCDVYVYIPDGGFVLQSASYRSEYTYGGASVVCDDRSTQFEYELLYRGEIDYVSVLLRGDSSGRERQVASFSPRSSENEAGEILRTFRISGGLAPLATLWLTPPAVTVEDALQDDAPLVAQAIEVVPRNPETIGYTVIEIRIETENGTRSLSSAPIRVLDYCG